MINFIRKDFFTTEIEQLNSQQINEVDNNGHTRLDYFTAIGNQDMVSKLLAVGATPYHNDLSGYNSIDQALLSLNPNIRSDHFKMLPNEVKMHFNEPTIEDFRDIIQKSFKASSTDFTTPHILKNGKKAVNILEDTKSTAAAIEITKLYTVIKNDEAHPIKAFFGTTPKVDEIPVLITKYSPLAAESADRNVVDNIEEAVIINAENV